MKFVLFLFLTAAAAAHASDTAPVRTAGKKTATVPYLGPGADKLSAEEYERVYKSYIQSSVLLGYPFLKEKTEPCEQALSAVFRSAGLFGYPVPSDAQQVQRTLKTAGNRKLETYECAGVIVQVARLAKTGALERLVLVNSASPKATRRLSPAARKDLLALERDPITGLENVKGIPVGYPHPFLTQEGQGLFVKELKFNGKLEGCQPLDFQDNAWVGGFDLSDDRCAELQGEAARVWHDELSPGDFAEAELMRMRALALKSALARGTKEAEAKAMVDKAFQPPFTSEINVVGSAMRNLAQCNLLALGRAGKSKATGAAEPGDTAPGAQGSGAGSAK